MYTYQLRIRPVSSFTVPNHPGMELSADNAIDWPYPHGSVSYPEPLSIQEIDHWSLVPVTETKVLDGTEYAEDWGKNGTLRRSIKVLDDYRIEVTGRFEEIEHVECMRYERVATAISTGKWVLLKTAP